MLQDKIALYLSRGKVSLRSAMKEYTGSGGSDPLKSEPRNAPTILYAG